MSTHRVRAFVRRHQRSEDALLLLIVLVALWLVIL